MAVVEIWNDLSPRLAYWQLLKSGMIFLAHALHFFKLCSITGSKLLNNFYMGVQLFRYGGGEGCRAVEL